MLRRGGVVATVMLWLQPVRLYNIGRTATAHSFLRAVTTIAPPRSVVPKSIALTGPRLPPAARYLSSSVRSPEVVLLAETYDHEEGETQVHLVTTVLQAQAVVEVLIRLPADTFHAVDTEVAELDIDKSPLGQGRVICVSAYSGPEVDYGSGPGKALWVDTTDLAVLEVLKPWLEDEAVLKVSTARMSSAEGKGGGLVGSGKGRRDSYGTRFSERASAWRRSTHACEGLRQLSGLCT